MYEPTNTYRGVLEDLAHSRGLSGAEELARQACAASPDFRVEEILEQPTRGSGAALDRVLDLDDEERRRLAEAFGRTYLNLKV